MTPRRPGADPRTFIILHDGMPDHPKIEGLSDRAFRLLITTWCWCSRHLTDGVVKSAVWEKRGNAKARRELIDAGLAEVLDNGDIYMHDYPEHQRTAAEVNGLRAARSSAGRRGNHTKHHVLAGAINPDCEYCAAETSQNGHNDLANGSQVRPQTTRKTSPETETDKENPPDPPKGGRAQARDYEDHPDFLRFWDAYPRKIGKPTALRAWKAAIKRGNDPEDLISAAKAYADDPERRAEYTKHPGPWLNDDRFSIQRQPSSGPRPFWEN